MRQLITLRQAAELGPYSAGEITRKIKRGVLLEGVHFTLPFRSKPLIIRDAYIAFLNGDDAHLRRSASTAPARRSSRKRDAVNFSVGAGF